MDHNLIYAKTPTGDEAVRQSTRVVQRNLRMVLVQVDGKLTVGELATKIGNPKLVEKALRELEEGGFIAPVLEAASVWEEAKRRIAEKVGGGSPASQFSTFGPKSLKGGEFRNSEGSRLSGSSGIPSVFSTFGKPILPADEVAAEPPGPGLVERLSARFSRRRQDEDLSMPRQFRPVMILWGVLLAAALAVAGVLFYPYDSFRPEVQAALSRAFMAPVTVEEVGLVLTPRPGLVVRGVAVGEGGASRIDEIRLPSPFALFGSSRRTLNGVEFIGARLAADHLGSLAAGSPDGAAPAGLVMGQAIVRQAVVTAGDAGLAGLNGEIFFKPGGGLDKMNLQSEDRTLRIEALPTALGIALKIEGYGWKPLADAPYVFESLQAKGVLQRGKLVLQDIDTTFMGGVLRGSLLLDWTNGVVMAADAALARLDARRVAAAFAVPLAIDGELSGGVKLRNAAPGWEALRSGVEGSMNAEVTRGAIHGLDLGEAARRGAGQAVRSGQTRFDSLKGYLRIGKDQVTGSDIRLAAGLMSADGQLVARRSGEVEGNFAVAIRSTASALRVPVRVSGQLPDLTATAGKR